MCTLTTSSDTFCTAVNEKRKHNGGAVRVGQSGSCRGEERARRIEVEGNKRETNEERMSRDEGGRRVKDKGRPKLCHSGRGKKKNH